MDDNTMELPELGTPEAALRSVVNLISRATGTPEAPLSYWLDLYYQVRRGVEGTPQSPPKAAAPAEAQEPTAPPPPREKPSKPAKDAGAAAAAKFKRETLKRLQAARTAGLSTPKIVQLADGNITEDQVRDILEAKPVPVNVYRVLAAALDRRDLNE